MNTQVHGYLSTPNSYSNHSKFERILDRLDGNCSKFQHCCDSLKGGWDSLKDMLPQDFHSHHPHGHDMHGQYGMPPPGQYGMPPGGSQPYGTTMSQSVADRLGNNGLPPHFPCHQPPTQYGTLGPNLFGQPEQQQPQAYRQHQPQHPQMPGHHGPQIPGHHGPQGPGHGHIQMDGPRAARELARHFDQISGGKDCKVTTQHLQHIASTGTMPNGQPAPPELRAACQHLLNNPRQLADMETADARNQGKKGTPDGQIGKGDINALLQRLGPAAGEQGTMAILDRHADKMVGHNGCFDKGTVQNIATTGKLPNGKDAPPDLITACKDLMARPELFDKLDNALRVRAGHGDERGDGKIHKNDIKAALSGPIEKKHV